MSDSGTYDNTGAPYNTSRILTPELTLDEEAYKNYSPLFMRYNQERPYRWSYANIWEALPLLWLTGCPSRP